MKKYFLFLLAITGIAFSQERTVEFQTFTGYSVFQVGINYMDGLYIDPGYDWYLVRANDDVLDLGLSANLTYKNDQFIWVPEASIGYLFNKKGSAIDPYSENFNAAFYVLRANVSPWHVTPEIGITVLDLIEINAGYGFEFRENSKTDLDGLKVGLSLRLPFLLFWHD